MIINGLGGRKYAKQHALKSAEIINRVNPKFLSTLTLSLPYGINHYKNRFNGNYEQQTIVELYEELLLFIENIDVNQLIYRSDHVSNNLILKGSLSKDKASLIEMIRIAIEGTNPAIFPKTSDVL